MNYALAADVLAALHLSIVLFVIFGLVAVLIGWGLKWRWVRHFWFRMVHLGVIAWVAGQAAAGIICPLTYWEQDLRKLAGQRGYEGTFVGHWIDGLLFSGTPLGQNTLTIIYIAFAATVVGTLIFVRPTRDLSTLAESRWILRFRRRANSSATATSAEQPEAGA